MATRGGRSGRGGRGGRGQAGVGDTGSTLDPRYQVTYQADAQKFEAFLRNFEVPLEEEPEEETPSDSVPTRPRFVPGSRPYWELLKQIANRTEKILDIYLDDLDKFLNPPGSEKYDDLCERVMNNAMRYIEIFSDSVDRLLPMHTVVLDPNDPIDVMRMHRTRTLAPNADIQFRMLSSDSQLLGQTDTSEGSAPADIPRGEPVPTENNNAPKPNSEPLDPLPKELTRRYELRIIPLSRSKEIPLRQVRARHIGKLVTIRGIVTRVTEVKPKMVVATYSCEQCGLEVYQHVTSKTFMPLLQCPSIRCKQSAHPGKLNMQTRGSKLVKFQEMKLQEVAQQVPVGHIPRTVKCHLVGEMTRQCSPGDVISINAVFLPIRNTGFKAIASGQLIADTYFHVMHIYQHKKKYSDYVPPADMQERLAKFTEEEPDPYHRLAMSIAPEIFGLEDVKKALLLQMVGGVTKEMPDGMKIRGDINICLMGDPGVAKSQLLKHIATIAPRAVYTSGKGSSGVGLTAAVLRDPNTKEFVLEGGSLVLADMGICCIDEFDKMEDADRTAIHEVMEQQTISIAKAGITTTLNARTSILAAANPAWGRYNTKRSPSENINLPAALLSRFDLLFLLLDEPDSTRDRELAQHITHVHRFSEAPTRHSEKTLDAEFMRGYISLAKKVDVHVPPELRDYIVSAYVGMRHQHSGSGIDGSRYRLHENEFGFTTARTLLAILRLSQALARVRLSEEVSQADVEEAIRLMERSKMSLYESRQRKRTVDPVSAIYNIVRDAIVAKDLHEIRYADILPIVLLKGFSQEQLNEVLDEYERLGIWMVSANREVISIVT